jgi:hypothetical protein
MVGGQPEQNGSSPKYPEQNGLDVWLKQLSAHFASAKTSDQTPVPSKIEKKNVFCISGGRSF